MNDIKARRKHTLRNPSFPSSQFSCCMSHTQPPLRQAAALTPVLVCIFFMNSLLAQKKETYIITMADFKTKKKPCHRGKSFTGFLPGAMVSLTAPHGVWCENWTHKLELSNCCSRIDG